MQGMMPTSLKTENLPPKKGLCSMNKMFLSFEKFCKELFLFSVIIIELFLFIYLAKKLTLVNVSRVLPDFEIRINKVFFENCFYKLTK